jgi:hypothetical protein
VKKCIFLYMVALLLVLWACGGCGVKGDPVAPASPAEIGRGKPLYKSPDDEPSFPVRKRYNPEGEEKDDQETDENK